ncbi:hypothetical protein [Nitrosomonas ureae]|uniref:Bacteriophage Rz lysis protein n=1 Tax=Nitrosomonas ureae TaxID=44577 RepID=A0A1H2EMQ5_9PROT|nr:hypothetical protein [Nitrosomonas ureae]ALQ51933.1 hypothetical protein ATY38_12295 [Nitrosomonas ureae]SDT96406.1 hypothetical protein SAMN05216406_1149 [Nitrosomonas ureae]
MSLPSPTLIKTGLIIAAITIVLALIAIVTYKIFDSGRLHERAIWQEDKAKTDKEAAELLAQERAKYEAALLKQKSDLIGAFNESEKLRNDLDRDLAESRKHRMYVSTQKPTSCSAAGEAKGSNSGGTGGTGEEVYWQELDPGAEQAIRNTFREIEEGKNACKVLLDKFALPNMEIVYP